jgi:putative transposase
MTRTTTTPSFALVPSIETAWQDVDRSFERFCLTAGMGTIEQMLHNDAQRLHRRPYSRGEHRVGQRCGTPTGKIGFHGGKVAVHRPRARSYDGREVDLLDLDGGAGRGLAWLLGHEPDADAQAAARGATTGR